MTNVPGNGPSLTDLARRLQRIEDRMDERIATTAMLSAQEKLFEARELGHVASLASLESRVKALEGANQSVVEGDRNRNRLVMVALISGLINMLILIISLTSKGVGAG